MFDCANLVGAHLSGAAVALALLICTNPTGANVAKSVLTGISRNKVDGIGMSLRRAGPLPGGQLPDDGRTEDPGRCRP
jgi:hypothetical protein